MTESRGGVRDGIVVITGGCGFIGSQLTAHMASLERPVRVLDDLSTGDPHRLPPNVEFIHGDVADPDCVRKAVADAAVVFHLAAVASVHESSWRWFRSHGTNSGGSVAVLEAIRSAAPDARFVFASSAAVYGNVHAGPAHRVDEATPTEPLTPYGVDKLSSEMHARVAGALFGVASCSLRLFNVFGPGQDPHSPYSGVISRFCEQAAGAGPLTVFGDGEQTRDFVYVGDVVRAFALAESVASTTAPVVNVCTSRATTINSLAESVARLTGHDLPIVHLEERPGDIRHSLGDPSLAAGLLGWRAEVDVRNGLAKLLRQANAR